jgi:hypothetical protein
MSRHVYFYTYLERPFERVRDVFVGAPEVWLPQPASQWNGGYVVDLDASGVLPPALARRSAVVETSPVSVTSDGDVLLRSLRWHASEREDWFPILDGDLELSRLTDASCQLTLSGSYRPPLAVVGQLGDRLLGHRIAEAVVCTFVVATASRMADSVVRGSLH